MKTLNERLDLIKPKILASDFRGGRGLGNEINFWIFDYAPVDEMAVSQSCGIPANKHQC